MFQSFGLAQNFSPPSPLTRRREIVALLRGPMPSPSQYLATQDFRRLDQWHLPLLAKLPEPSDAQKNDFGMQESGSFSVDVAASGPALAVPTLRFDWTTEVFADRVNGLVPPFTRAGATATRINRYGFIEVVAANTPRFDYDPLTLALKGVLFEEARTNLIVRSNEFATTWTPAGTPAATQNLTGPDGITSGWTITDNDAAAYEGVTTNLAVANDAVTRTFSLLIRKNPGATHTFGMNLGYNGGTVVSGTPRLNADTGAVVNGAAITTAFQDWWGLTQSFTNNASGNTNFYLGIYPATAVWPAADAAATQGSQGIYGAQLEVGSFRTSYIPTGAAAVTRNADVLMMALTPWFNPAAGTMVVEFLIGEDTSAGVFLFNDTTGDNLIEAYCTGGLINCRVVAGTVVQCTLSGGAAPASSRHRLAFAYAANDCRASFDGGAVVSDFAVTLPVLTQGFLGASSSVGWLNGHLVRFSYYPTARSDADLVAMSTPGVNACDFGPPQLLKNQPVDLDLLTRVTREDGTTVDFINERRGFVKSITRKREGLTLNVVDVDRVALKTLYPLAAYTVANWPNLYVDHVNRAVAEGVGIGEKIPCAYVDNTVGAYKYAVCRCRPGVTNPAVLTVYRGKSAGQGQIVPPAEYVASVSTVGGIDYRLITFTREQIDFDGQPFVIEADAEGYGSRLAADELGTVLAALGLTIDAADFADAAAYHATINARVDAWYTKQVPGDSIITPLLQVARGWLAQTVGGAYSLAIDRPRTPQRLLWDEGDEVQVDERSEPEVAKTITLRYRPRPGSRSEFAGDLSRTTTAPSGEKVFSNELVRDHDTADRLLDYLTKKEARAAIRATLYGVQLTPGELVAINSPLVFDGWKSLAAEQISRVPDGCQVVGEEYSAADYVYTPGTLPADATNAYTPDYSYTPPVAPTGLAVISQGISVDAGTGTAYALIRAVPPALNWAKLTAQIRNTVTNEIYQAQLVLSGGNYEAQIAGLRPNVAHQVTAWATNGNNLDGVTAAAVAFTSANFTGAPNAPTSLAANQTGADQIEVKFTPSSSGAIVTGYIPYMQIGAGSFVAQPVIEGASYKQNISYTNFGTSLTFKFKAVDRFGNQSADSGTVSITPAAYLGDGHVAPLGIGTASFANNSVRDGKVNKSINTTSVSVPASSNVQFGFGASAAYGKIFAWRVYSPSAGHNVDLALFAGDDSGSPAPYSTVTVKNINTTTARDASFDSLEVGT